MANTSKVCEICSSVFVGAHIDKRFCSKLCALTSANRKRAEAKRLANPATVGHCKFCTKEFSRVPGAPGRPQIYCSDLCHQKKFALDHPDEIRARRKRVYAKSGADIRAKSSEWQKANPEKKRAKQSAWAKTEKGKLTGKAAIHRRRARKLNAGGSFTRTEFKALCTATGNRCLCCGQAVGLAKLTADHIVALANGGHNGIGNIQPLCQPCNTAKGVETINYFTPYALEGEVIYAPARYAPQLTAA